MAHPHPGPDAGPDYSNTPGINRRQLALGSISLVALGAGLLRLQAAGAADAPAAAAGTAAVSPAETAAFLAFSKAITGHKDLDAITAGRICAAMAKASSDFGPQLQQLVGLVSPDRQPKELLAQASEIGLGGTALSVVAAWYTGTVGSGAGATMVAYARALMYQPVADGMTVPTYCNFGPLWWTAAPPAIRVSAPVQPRPAAAAPTTGTPTPTQGTPAAPRSTPQPSGTH